MTLLFLITLINGVSCSVYLPDSGDYIRTFESYSNIIDSIDVYPSSSLSSELQQKIFDSVNVSITIDGNDYTVYCRD